jgi:NAD(P)H-hydrate repair Nnr-like enzyme with NAD(P)H-hydrate epimerase domain
MVLAGAVRGVAQSVASGARSAPPPASAPAAGGAGSGDAFEAARVLQQEGQSFNLRYLELQERLQRETREFTALSNVMKVRHDAARAAIQNVQ